MKKEIHFFTRNHTQYEWRAEHNYLTMHYADSLLEILGDYEETKERYDDMDGGKHSVYVTTQMCFLDTQWLVHGYRLFVHDKTGSFEIVLGDGNERTQRTIREAHNLYRMWTNGEFAKSE